MYYNIIILWDHRCICGLLLTETSLCGAWLYLPRHSGHLYGTHTQKQWSCTQNVVLEVVVRLTSICSLLVRFPKPEQQWIQVFWIEPLPAFQAKAILDLVPQNWTICCMWNQGNTQFVFSDFKYFVCNKLEQIWIETLSSYETHKNIGFKSF